MKKRLATFAAVTALGAASLGAYQTSLAADGPSTQKNPPIMAKQQCAKAHRDHMQHMRSPWNLGLRFDKHLTQNDAKTLVSAALLMQGRHDLSVGKVETKATPNNHNLYLVTIQDAKGTAVTTVVVSSKSGHIRPLSDPKKGRFPGPKRG